MRCNTCLMSNSAFSQLDFRKWFDRMQPQTVAIATWLLYIDGVFNFLHYLDKNEVYGAWRWNGGPMSLVALLAALAFPIGGFLIANGKKFGWYIALVAAFSPFFLRIMWRLLENDMMTVKDIVIGSTFVNFMFEAALPALLLHPMSRSYVKTWLR
jgi:predicted ferric reductase